MGDIMKFKNQIALSLSTLCQKSSLITIGHSYPYSTILLVCIISGPPVAIKDAKNGDDESFTGSSYFKEDGRVKSERGAFTSREADFIRATSRSTKKTQRPLVLEYPPFGRRTL